MNYSDSARIRAVLTNCGFLYSETEEEADIIIFDTCSIKQKAEDKITGRLKEIPKDKRIWITGCMVQHNFRLSPLTKGGGEAGGSKPLSAFKRGNFIGSIKTVNPKVIGKTNEEIKELKSKKNADFSSSIFINHAYNPLFFELNKTYPHLELFFRIDDTGFLPLMLQTLGYENIKINTELFNEYEKIIPNEGASMNTHNKTAYIPISTGCNQFCAYCIVPFARGLERHFPAEQIINEAKQHLKNWVKEISLLGQIVNKHPDFVHILKEILKLEGLEWLRYTSPYPTYYSEELLQLHETEEKLCPHIHIPFQSGSTSVLKKMFRGYTAEQCYQFIDKIRALKREISITTDMIIWFPDETEEEFEKSLQLVEYGKFDMVYMGIYSNRPGTFADKKYTDNIPYEVKHQRRTKMNELLKNISTENNQKELWTKIKMMINKIDKDGNLYGYTTNMKQVNVPLRLHSPWLEEDEWKPEGANFQPWDIIPIIITEAQKFKLIGETIYYFSIWNLSSKK